MSHEDELDYWELLHQPLSKQNAQLFNKMYEQTKEYQKACKKSVQRASQSHIVDLLNNQKIRKKE